MNEKVYVLRINSESGDDYGCWVFVNKPSEIEIKAVMKNLQESEEYLSYDIVEADFYK